MTGKERGQRVRQRPLAMLLTLQAGDQAGEALIEQVSQIVGPDGYGESPADTLLRDIQYLRSLGFEITYW